MQPMTVAMTGQEQESQEHEMQEGEEECGCLDLLTFTQWVQECQDQPDWRVKADREYDYCDGNQLDSEVMRKARERGLPPAIEPLIGPTIDSVLGMEAKTRTDWRVIPDGDKQSDDVADALNYRLNQAERHSKADNACSDAYASQVKVGLGWVEVAREQNPFRYPYRCQDVHRNEIWFDWKSRPDMSDARFLIRRKWMHRKLAALMIPAKAELIETAGAGWQQFDPGALGLEGGGSTGLANSWLDERGWSIEEQNWRDIHNQQVCLFEVWYRDWQTITYIKSPDGRVVEYDPASPLHMHAVANGVVEASTAVVGKVRLAWFMGPHKLADMPSPYKHDKFPYVPFWGKREDRTGVPYGLVRGMIYLQDEVNARIARMQWGLAATRTTRTDGAVLDDDDTFRDEVGRPDADIVLDAEAMRQGGVFKVERDFELNRQQYDRLVDAREGIKRVGGVSDAFMGMSKGNSGVADAQLLEQSNQMLADINDNFKTSRQAVGDLLLSLIIEDMAGKQEDVFIDGQSLKEDRTVRLNVPMVDEATGIRYLDNDIERTKLKVTLSDVASTPSFRAQQLAVMGEAFKSSPPEYQKVMMPHLFALMDVPNKKEIIEAIKELGNGQITEEQVQERIKAAVADALTKAMIELKRTEIEQKQPLIDAQVKKTNAESVNKNVEAQFGAIQTAQTITAIPQTAPLADMLLQSDGFVDANGGTIMPSAPAPVVGAMPAQEGRPAQLDPAQVEAIQRRQPATQREVLGRRNTSPQFPANPGQPANPDVGVNAGIEGGQ